MGKRGRETFSCPTCFNNFSSKGNLKKHMVVHFEVKPFCCPTCQKQFSQKHRLNHHITAKHLKKIQFSCPTCQKQFSQKHRLNNHITAIHFKKIQFSCPICFKNFSKKFTLSLHIEKVHFGDGERNFKQFTRCKGKLVNHIYFHETEELFKCLICWSRFTKKSYLIDHSYARGGSPYIFSPWKDLNKHLYCAKKRSTSETCVEAFTQSIGYMIGDSPLSKSGQNSHDLFINQSSSILSEELKLVAHKITAKDATIKREPKDVEPTCTNVFDDLFIKREEENPFEELECEFEEVECEFEEIDREFILGV